MTVTRAIIVYGVITGLVLEALFLGTMALGAHSGDLGMAVGFLTMFIAMSIIFVGVKRHRDIELGGVIRFWPALGLGLGIALVASTFYMLGWEIYLFATDYAYVDVVIEMGFPDYGNPLYRMPLTLTEIAPVLLIVPLVSAALLRNPRFMPHEATG